MNCYMFRGMSEPQQTKEKNKHAVKIEYIYVYTDTYKKHSVRLTGFSLTHS